MTKRSSSGFSLAEASIVLIVSALIIASVLKGRSLIDEARMRAVMKEIESHRINVHGFFSVYNQLPGDFSQARMFWDGINIGVGGSIANTGVINNGNNDGQIAFLSGGVYEGFNAWQHLTLAGMTETQYAGTMAADNIPISGVDMPNSKSKGSYFFDAGTMGLAGQNVLLLGAPNGAIPDTSPMALLPVLSPYQMHSMDNKSDDGQPGSGAIRGDDNGDVDSNVGNCDADDQSGCCTMQDGTNQYHLDTGEFSCVAGFLLAVE